MHPGCVNRWPQNAADRPVWVISRSMSEGNLPAREAKCLAERADEVWVPTQYHVDMFVQAKVTAPAYRLLAVRQLSLLCR